MSIKIIELIENWKVKSQFLFKSPVAIELFGAAGMELTAESIVVVNMIFKYILNGTMLQMQRIILNCSTSTLATIIYVYYRYFELNAAFLS